MKRGEFPSIFWLLASIGIGMAVTFLLTKTGALPIIQQLSNEGQQLTVQVLQQLDCNIRKISLDDLAKKVWENYLSSEGLSKYVDSLTSAGFTWNAVYQSCQQILSPVMCDYINYGIKKYCYSAILKYSFNSADKDVVETALGCFYILYGDSALTTNSIVCCTPLGNKLVKKLVDCGIIRDIYYSYSELCGSKIKVTINFFTQTFSGYLSEKCYSYLINDIKSLQSSILFT